MKVLLDTHAFLWFVADDPRLSALAKTVLESEGTQAALSIASAWEMGIKVSLKKLDVSLPLAAFIAEQVALNGFDVLPVQLSHVDGVVDLPFHHRDPFDRLLAAQCVAERLSIVSADRVFDAYGVSRIW